MTAPKKIIDLVETFDRNYESYKAGKYQEAQLRQEFINPFFKVLGWDMDNEQGLAEAYKDVIHEDSIKIAGGTKAPDYCFRVGGTRKFFVEAKKPSVHIKTDISPAYQIRRYAWSSKLPLSILTDFEEFSVYDCRIGPSKHDSASVARINYYTYKEYADKWDEIASVFSRDAILKGSFDKYVESTRGKRGTTEVDDAFLKEIESWREELAKNIAAENPRLSQPELNFAVQRTIDRIIFLRICEDRGTEEYSRLMALLNGRGVYDRMRDLFHKADEKYNSGLFHFQKEKERAEQPDELTLKLRIGDAPLQDIIKRLYYPDSPYEFSVLPLVILGQVYEQFLGKVIRLTAGHRAVIEEKPEVRKAGGIYYTPTYIVDYIVKNTVGKLLEGKTPKQVNDIKILDPACGSGSFLIGAYQYLLDWHREWYVKDGMKKWAVKKIPVLYQDSRGEWQLTTAEKKRILLNNMFGVDIDSQAVEVTKLSLLLKVLEGETEQTINSTIRLFHERALPDLGNNIKCGNSLIGPDFYENQQMSLMNDEERSKINAFDWETGFPEVFNRKNPGFDAVIGNPPYIRVRIFRELYPNQIDYLESSYKCATHVWDIYMLFFERAIRGLRASGLCGFIVPIQTLHQPNCESLRKFLLDEGSLVSIADLSLLKVFATAIVKNCILIVKATKHPDSLIDMYLPDSPTDLFEKPAWRWPQKKVRQNSGYSLKTDLLSPKRELCEKLKEKSWQLGDLCYVTFGMRSCAKGRGQGGKDRLITPNSSARNAKPYLEGRDINRYAMHPTGKFIKYIPEEMYSPRTPALFENKKLVSQSMLSRKRLIATLDEEGYYVEQSLVCIIPHGIITDKTLLKTERDIPLEFILGILNSCLQSFYFASSIIDFSLGGGLIHATPGSQEKLIIPHASDAEIKSMVKHVRRILDLNKKLMTAKLPQDKDSIQCEIAATDRQIDELVYGLYGLTEGEIKIVEEGTI